MNATDFPRVAKSLLWLWVLSLSSLIGEFCDCCFLFGSIVMFLFLFPVFVFLLLSTTEPIPPPPLNVLNEYIVFDREETVVDDGAAAFLILDLFISFQANSANVGATAATRTVVAVDIVVPISMLVITASVTGPIMIPDALLLFDK